MASLEVNIHTFRFRLVFGLPLSLPQMEKRWDEFTNFKFKIKNRV